MFGYGRFENIPAVSKSRRSNAEAALTSLMYPLRGYSITELDLEHLKRGGLAHLLRQRHRPPTSWSIGSVPTSFSTCSPITSSDTCVKRSHLCSSTMKTRSPPRRNTTPPSHPPSLRRAHKTRPAPYARRMASPCTASRRCSPISPRSPRTASGPNCPELTASIQITRPTPLQQKAFDLLGVKL
jgi:hypothetical protein